MRNYLRLIAASAVAGLGSGIGTANAGVFDRQTENYYYFKDFAMAYSDAGNGNYAMDSHREVSNVVDGFGTIDFNSEGIEIGIGEVFSAIDDSHTSFNLISNTGASETPALNFDVDHLHANRQRLSSSGDTVNSSEDVKAVPEPDTHTMLIVGFGMLGYSVRRRRRIGY